MRREGCDVVIAEEVSSKVEEPGGRTIGVHKQHLLVWVAKTTN